VKSRLLESAPVRIARRYLDAQGGNWATIIAWNAFFAFFPLVLVMVTVLGLILQNPGIKGNLENQVVHAFPECASDRGCAVLTALDDFRQRTGVFGVVAFVGLLWTGSSLFGAIDQGLASLFPCKPRSFIRQRLMAFGMILLFTALAVPLLLSSSLLSLLQSLPATPQFFRGGVASLLVQIGAGVLDAMLLFAAIYYVVPNRRQRLRGVLPGALAAGVLFEGFTLVFPLYFKVSGGFDRWGQTFALIFVLLFYFYVLGLIVMLGGAVNAELDPDLSESRSGPDLAAGELGSVTPPRAAPGEAPGPVAGLRRRGRRSAPRSDGRPAAGSARPAARSATPAPPGRAAPPTEPRPERQPAPRAGSPGRAHGRPGR
jgi:membrane protein